MQFYFPKDLTAIMQRLAVTSVHLYFDMTDQKVDRYTCGHFFPPHPVCQKLKSSSKYSHYLSRQPGIVYQGGTGWGRRGGSGAGEGIWKQGPYHVQKQKS